MIDLSALYGNEHIKKVTWKYCLKPDTINIQPYRSDERDYLEIEIMEVQLNLKTNTINHTTVTRVYNVSYQELNV